MRAAGNQSIATLEAARKPGGFFVGECGYPRFGLLINFGEWSLRYRRIFPPRKITEHRVNRQWLFVPDWLKPEQTLDSTSGGSGLNSLNETRPARSVKSVEDLAEGLVA